jgi:hypothetical protein
VAAAQVAAALARGARLGADECERDDARLTGIVPAPRLACLANATSDALDPGARRLARDGVAGPEAQLRLRLAMQPWIDDPIDYPLLGDSAPVAPATLTALAQAAGTALPA